MKERRDRIVEKVTRAQFLTVQELSQEIGVSEVTIRKDLNELEKQNLLIRTHGGANSINSTVPSFSNRELIAKKEKEKIALATSNLIEDGDSVFIDSGTTTLAVANVLKVRDLSIVTNSIPVGMELANFKGNVSFTSGEIQKETMGLCGTDTENYLKNIQVNKLIIGTSGVNLHKGLTTSSSMEMAVKKSMIDSAQTVIAVLDCTKFKKIKTFLFAEFKDIDVVVTTKEIPDEAYKIFKKKGVQMILI